MTTTTTAPAVPTVELPRRLAGLDRLRGLAVVLMVLDHAALFIPHGDLFRYTGGRIALPLFFLVAGSLLGTRTRWARLAVCAAAGLALPLVVPWIDSPNVLVWYALGAVLVTAGMRSTGVRWLALVLMLGCAANPALFPTTPGSYPGFALYGLLLAGSLLGRAPLHTLGAHLPAWLAACGRYPLTVYVVHVLAIQGLVLAL